MSQVTPTATTMTISTGGGASAAKNKNNNDDHPFLEGIDGEKLYYEDDEWTPSVAWILVLVSVVAAVAAGVGVGIWQAKEQRGKSNSDKVPMPTLLPTMAPTVTAVPTTAAELFVCQICGSSIPNAVVDNPIAEITLPLTEDQTRTCEEWLTLGLSGGIRRDECVKFIPSVVAPCECRAAPTIAPTVSPAPSILITRSPAFFACELCGSPEEGIADASGTIEIPGGDAIACGALEEAAANGLVPEEQCTDQLFAAIRSNCGCTFRCQLCPPGQAVTNPNGVVELPLGQPSQTCLELINAIDANEINIQQCALIQPAAKEPCGCTPDVQV